MSAPVGRSRAQAVITQMLRDAVPERTLQIDADVGRRCSGCASGVVGAVDCWLSGPASHSSAQAVIAQTLRNAVPERALQIAADVGQRCSGWASGVVGAVDRCLSAPASHSNAQAVIALSCESRFPSGHCRLPPRWVGGVVVARVAWWVVWIAGCLVHASARAPKP